MPSWVSGDDDPGRLAMTIVAGLRRRPGALTGQDDWPFW
jgi:hypothetical protein